MKFLLIIPPYVVDENGLGICPKKAMLPVGPLSIATALLTRGHAVEALDLVFVSEWCERLVSILQAPYDRILLSCHTTRNIAVCKQAEPLIRSLQPGAHITLGGNVCVDLGTEDFRKLGLHVDAVVRGYGHADNVIKAIECGENGDIRPQSVPQDLPAPALHLLDEETHRQYREETSGGKYPMIGPGGFGCYWSCEYCSAKMNSPAVVRTWKGIEIESEINLAVDYGYTHLWCVDNLVIHNNEEKVLRFDSEVGKRGLTWSGMTRPELVLKHSHLFSKLHSLTELAVGIESASPQELTVWGRGNRVGYLETCHMAVRIVHDAGIATNAFVMLGGPGANEQGFWELYRFLKSLPLSTISWSFFNPSPKTLAADQLEPKQFGFYRWPLLSAVPPARVVQWAMILSGSWWSGWRLNESDPFFSDDERFGIRFEEGIIYQPTDARSEIGDLWEIWRRGRMA